MNFRSIHRLSLEFRQLSGDREPRIMLIGPNSTGKSTVLKAIALAMATPSVRRRLEPDARNCWNRQADKRRHDRGFVLLTFNEGDPVELRFSWRSKEYEFVGTPPHLPLLAYGSTRVPPRRHGKAPMPSRVRLNNLFSTRASLSNVHAWLADPQRVKATDFKSLVKSFRDLLPMGNDAEVRRRAGQVYSSLFADVTPLDDLSDGYRSAVALASDIMMNLSTTVFSMEHVEGTVLLDEIGVHLHPSWKIEIVSKLRTLFPKVRFVSTTHEPLWLRGLEDGEIYRMNRRRTTKRVFIEPVNVPPGLRVDELLTGPWFELDGTYDAGTTEMLVEHRRMLRAGLSRQDEDMPRSRISFFDNASGTMPIRRWRGRPACGRRDSRRRERSHPSATQARSAEAGRLQEEARAAAS